MSHEHETVESGPSAAGTSIADDGYTELVLARLPHARRAIDVSLISALIQASVVAAVVVVPFVWTICKESAE